eukprot:3671607-Prymnesium_polylepis.1
MWVVAQRSLPRTAGLRPAADRHASVQEAFAKVTAGIKQRNPFLLLGIHLSQTPLDQTQIDRAFRARSRLTHPDRHCAQPSSHLGSVPVGDPAVPGRQRGVHACSERFIFLACQSKRRHGVAAPDW